MTVATKSPVRIAVEPLKAEAIAKAEASAREQIAALTAELEAGGWDLNVVAPLPPRPPVGMNANSGEFMMMRMERLRAEQERERFSGLFIPPGGTEPLRGQPYIVKPYEWGQERYIRECKESADAAYEKYICKLEKKCGEVVSAELEGNHLWGYSHLTVVDADGNETVYRTQTIWNMSRYGKMFNQYPTRKVKSK